jgi:ribonuclease-3
MDIQGNQTVETPQRLSQRLGLNFKDSLLLSRSLTHRSYLNEHPEALEDNERLEFLGDAVLDFLVGAWLYNRFPELAEGPLTRFRSALVRTEQLAKFSKEIGLGKALKLGHGEEESGGRERSAILCATFEAFIGAIFLDSGIGKVKEFIEPMLESVVEQILQSGKIQDPKSKLQEWVQSNGDSTPVYQLVSTTGPDHNKIFEIEVLINGKKFGSGTGHSKQAATKAAAQEAISALGIE